MNIEEIKKRLSENAYAYGGEALAQEDVAYLLSIIEKYKKALEAIADMYDSYGTPSEIAFEVLKEG